MEKSRKRKKIMAIDDEESILMAVKMNLKDKYEVLTLLDARDVISQVNRHKPDLILLDILMPAMGGIEVCEMLDGDSIGKNIPIIALTALEKTAVKLKECKRRVVDYCIKPIDKNGLIDKIEKALKNRKQNL